MIAITDATICRCRHAGRDHEKKKLGFHSITKPGAKVAGIETGYASCLYAGCPCQKLAPAEAEAA